MYDNQEDIILEELSKKKIRKEYYIYEILPNFKNTSEEREELKDSLKNLLKKEYIKIAKEDTYYLEIYQSTTQFDYRNFRVKLTFNGARLVYTKKASEISMRDIADNSTTLKYKVNKFFNKYIIPNLVPFVFTIVAAFIIYLLKWN